MKLTNTMLGAGLLLQSLPMAAQQEKTPNIIYVFADQLRADVLGYTGDKKAITPNIDRFAGQSVDFMNAVAITPVSAAYRASLITGKYSSSTGMVINEINLNPNHRTIAHVLADAGYDLGYVGKVHWNDQHRRPFKKGPERMGFDGYWAAYSFNHHSYDAFYYTDGPDGEEEYVSLKGQYGPEVFTGLAVDYLREASRGDKPFALFLSWNPPHDPWVRSNVLESAYQKFENTTFELPANFRNSPDKYMDRFPGEFFEGTEQWKEDFISKDGYQETMRCYYAMAHSVDEQFGRILSLVDELGIADNTIIVFTSDHGEMMTSQRRMYKLTFYDEASRIPFLVRYPGNEGGCSSDVCLNTPDIAPTILGAAGLSCMIPEEMEGMDLSYILRNESGEEPGMAFMQGMGHTYLWKDGYEWRAIRDKQYTYARYLVDGSELLFDRKADPHCLQNRVADPSYQTVLERLRKQMADKMQDLNDEFKPCTWYCENWMYKEYSIRAAARGEFGPLPPVEPFRK